MANSNKQQSFLAVQARDIFTTQATQKLPELARAVLDKFAALVDQPGSSFERHTRRDAWISFQKFGKAWVTGTHRAWRSAHLKAGQPSAPFAAINIANFELLDNEVMEGKILASRFALCMADVVAWELSDLRLRVQNLEQNSEIGADDILRPEALARWIVEQWTAAGMSRESWGYVQDVIQTRMSEFALEAYHAANEFLAQNGVMAEIDLRPLVKRTSSTGRIGSPVDSLRNSGFPHDETRMQTATSSLGRAKMRAQGVFGTLKRLLSSQGVGFDDTRKSQVSPQLAVAMANHEGTVAGGMQTAVMEAPSGGYRPEHVAQMSTEIRQRTSVLKKVASTSVEKATIEIVALMFQAILAEDRIPPAIRVWFARLQMPVLRVAITEPEFFGTLEHPARRLIDRMGSCALGFDVAVAGGAMEIEIKRIVQVIEQYPETGRRVFQLVFDEFQKFLSKFLSENGNAARVVSIAQQVEQKETMAIQYTIEMRKMLNDMPVREAIREFLFKVWAEVLALAAMRSGAQHEQTMMLKRAASNLVWAASAKPNRADRAKVIADLPKLLQLLRTGMSMLAMDSAAQEQQLKIISDTLADAFMSKTDAISSERIDAMAKRLTNLEDFLSDEDVGDLPLDTEALVMMIGIDASDIEVVTDGGSQPNEAMRAWAQELQLGSWFSLDHNGRVNNVQFAWRSDRKQLHLFASNDGHSFLIQARRLAAYLQAGLLLPIEEETLTVRATRDALAKLEANPERLLG